MVLRERRDHCAYKKPGSKPDRSLNVPKAPPDPDADRKVRVFLRKMMPNHPMLQDDD
jgi:hypothetical protein